MRQEVFGQLDTQLSFGSSSRIMQGNPYRADLKRCRRSAKSHQVQLVPQHIHSLASSRKTSSIHMYTFFFCRATEKQWFSLKELQMKKQTASIALLHVCALLLISTKQELREEHHIWEEPAMINQSEPLEPNGKQWAGKRERFSLHGEKAKSGHEQAASCDPLPWAQSYIQEGFLLLSRFSSLSEETLPSSSCFTSISGLSDILIPGTPESPAQNTAVCFRDTAIVHNAVLQGEKTLRNMQEMNS